MATFLKWTKRFSIAVLLLGAVTAHAGYGDPGPYVVVSQTYGSWTGGPNTTTDISDYFNTPNSYVTNTLGIQMNAVPLRAKVFRPSGVINRPIVFILHGNHNPAEPSFQGYNYLAQHLASHGYVVVEPDEDFLNGASGEMDARAIVLLRHLQLWREWSQTPAHPYFNLANMNKIAFMGHSRGGEAIVVAKKFNTIHSTPYWPPNWFNFTIGPMFAFAPTDKLILTDLDPYAGVLYFSDPAFPNDPTHSMPISTDDSSYGVMQGSHDDDVIFFVGQNQYERAQPVTGAATKHKSAVWIYGANHKHFNSVWAAPCVADPHTAACADSAAAPRPLSALITPANAQQVAKVFATAFLRHNLLGLNTKALLTQQTADTSLPAGVTVLTRYQDKDRVMLDHYEEDNNVATGSRAGVTNSAVSLAQQDELYLNPNEFWFFGVPVEAPGYPHSYLSTDGLIVAWDALTDEYRVNFASINTVGPLTVTYPILQFDVAQMFEFTPDKNTVGQSKDFAVRVQLQNAFGVIVNGPPVNVSAYDTLPYPDVVFQDGTTTIDGSLTHNFLRTVRVPLTQLVAGTGLSPSRIRGITFRFKQQPAGRIQIDNLQLTK